MQQTHMHTDVRTHAHTDRKMRAHAHRRESSFTDIVLTFKETPTAAEGSDSAELHVMYRV